VEVNQSAIIHFVDVICAEYEDMFTVVLEKACFASPYGIRRPQVGFIGLGLHTMQFIEPCHRSDVFADGLRIVLSQQVCALQSGIEAV
jgi:hypothetical protein